VNEAAARALLERLADAPVVLWRGDSLSGTDIDILVTGEWERTLRDAGLQPRRDGHWTNAAGDVIVDPVPAERWSRAYPPAADVMARAEGRPAVASSLDRTAIFIADAVGGRSMTKLTPKLRAVAGGDPVAALVLQAVPRRDALPWRTAVRVVLRVPRVRHALLARVHARLPQKKR
jgi:hypothetical protein